jgi:dihydrodipicolinate synthase/N-acetylneuraminate lyase
MSTALSADGRQNLLKSLFPSGIPRLWCPSLTHYDRDGGLNAKRMGAHLRSIAPHVKGLLIPGSTGDGWDLSPAETRGLLEITIEQARAFGLHLLIGILKPTSSETVQTLEETNAWLKSRAQGTSGLDDTIYLARQSICGFAVCAPHGAKVTQTEMADAFKRVLSLGLPTALYQLPQVTQNEIGAELASTLAGECSNFIMFKDSSGADRILLSGEPLHSVFAMRGAEGDYARWLKPRGAYHGFLLSTANCFAAQLHGMIGDIEAGQMERAQQISVRLTGMIKEAFDLAATVPKGNPYTNANKAMDHFFAYGPTAIKEPPPRLHSGIELPLEVIRATGEALSRFGFLPAKGYLE